ncbi:Pyocin activator protein PrtN [Octadecabacter temperatus]|uniref:Pyocin activator protein PrtN n=1 Tax=Octadecabacter temperatus TaxID=1458307 RepID=A0A0K0Y4D8_9RHOB|nr:pyocin activator PrtN family protein [Octadecabacter temperatus]AKS45795.1 Pyocin activator protein PrtN [Octadecabacter temperatus]SIO00699.1 Pyocin activator protein PrtN [Octadecabacter temperatus]
MDTLWMLTGRYEGLPIIPVDVVVKDYFPHLTLPKFLRKVSDGKIKLNVIRMEDSQKAAKGVHVRDLATYVDERHADGLEEFSRLHS